MLIVLKKTCESFAELWLLWIHENIEGGGNKSIVFIVVNTIPMEESKSKITTHMSIL